MDCLPIEFQIHRNSPLLELRLKLGEGADKGSAQSTAKIPVDLLEIPITALPQAAAPDVIQSPCPAVCARCPKMVLLTMTPSMVEGLKRIQGDATSIDGTSTAMIICAEGEPDLDSPEVAKPISHTQVLQLSKALKAISDAEKSAEKPSLEALLVGTRVYVPPPPPPKPEPVRHPFFIPEVFLPLSSVLVSIPSLTLCLFFSVISHRLPSTKL